MKYLIFIIPILGFVACNKSADKDFCKFANVKPQYQYLYNGEVIKGCEVLKAESKKSEMEGYKVIGHEVKLKVKIEQAEDDCDSKTGLNCNLLDRDCIMDNGKKANFCKYPDAVVRTPKGKVREIIRTLALLEEDGGEHKMNVISNNESK